MSFLILKLYLESMFEKTGNYLEVWIISADFASFGLWEFFSVIHCIVEIIFENTRRTRHFDLMKWSLITSFYYIVCVNKNWSVALIANMYKNLNYL
ncbi:hypothetical protein BpHYR1_039020 [Brachionus plicatilis]|uniref:Uncharacterized protein n=1 Tax=Brachionus plicatilis TaxID=10195 RepID=A0A3M7RM59_BRAPC|nr:hypothetical protein BpHYR1_039020 [Brachionus plicatilis]